LLAAAAVAALATALQQLAAQPFRTPENQPAELFRGFFRDPTVPTQPQTNPHPASFLATHGTTGNPADTACTSCHTPTFCTDCHASLTVPVEIHPAGYMMLHGPEALARAQDCTSCHAPERFCADCHTQADLLHDRGEPAFNPHGPDWMDPLSPFNHASECRSNLASCMSCHTADSCATCHTVVNPHGDDIRQTCAMFLRAGSPICADCHNDRSVLSMEMLRQLPDCR
jgi:hypothetical protein